ncbi:MAG: 3,4-dihydroxy-2-butanone-4-phosphate synthase, partial [Candidatus Omnitrophica bacterium]|nr:3,4-dihydroxy-2-butanone-4-phosphate synthase [Candidatus Omnitrophota bacterium]
MVEVMRRYSTFESARLGLYDAGFNWIKEGNKYHDIYKDYRNIISPQTKFETLKPYIYPQEVTKDSVIIDIGCGKHAIALKLIQDMREQDIDWKFIPRFIGVDFTPKDKVLRDGKGKLEYIQMDKQNSNKVPVPGEGIADRIWIISSLHHMYKEVILSILGEAYRLLKSTGELIVFEDVVLETQKPKVSREGLAWRKVKKLSEEERRIAFTIFDWHANCVVAGDIYVPMPGSYFSESEWLRVFSQAGFSVERKYFIGVYKKKFSNLPHSVFVLKKSNLSNNEGKIVAFSSPVEAKDGNIASFRISSIPEVIEDLKQGRMIILVDDENRENEGDLMIAAQKVTPQAIAFMAKEASGLICVPMEGSRLDELKLGLMLKESSDKHGTWFTVSVDAIEKTTTGISAFDRAKTVKVLIDSKTKPGDLTRPGHMFPLQAREGGVLERAGHTEASVTLAKLAGLYPAAVICEVMNEDGTMARLPQLAEFAKRHNLKIATIADLIIYISSATSSSPVARDIIKPYPASSSPLNQANPFVPLAVKRSYENELPYQTHIRAVLASDTKYSLKLEKGKYKVNQEGILQDAFDKAAISARAPPEILIVISKSPSNKRELLTVWGINHKNSFQDNLPELTLFIHSYFFHDDFDSEQRANFISQVLKEITEKFDTASSSIDRCFGSPIEAVAMYEMVKIRDLTGPLSNAPGRRGDRVNVLAMRDEIYQGLKEDDTDDRKFAKAADLLGFILRQVDPQHKYTFETDRVHPFAVLYYIRKFYPSADISLLLAGLFHDIERFFVELKANKLKDAMLDEEIRKKVIHALNSRRIAEVLFQGLKFKDWQLKKILFLIEHHEAGLDAVSVSGITLRG